MAKKKRPIGKLGRSRKAPRAATMLSPDRRELQSLLRKWKNGNKQRARLKELVQSVGTYEEECLLRMLKRAKPSVWGD